MEGVARIDHRGAMRARNFLPTLDACCMNFLKEKVLYQHGDPH